MRQRWEYTDQPFLHVPGGNPFTNRRFDTDQISNLKIGMLPLGLNNYIQDARFVLPKLKFKDHVCHTEWLATGEPWPVDPALPPVVLLAGFIPECCVMPCDFEDCKRLDVNGFPASQQYVYPIPAITADGTTPVRQFVTAEALVVAGGNWPGTVDNWFPTGTDNPVAYSQTDLARPTGVPYSNVTQYTFDPGNVTTETFDNSGWSLAIQKGPDNGELTAEVVAGQLKLGGTNVLVDPSILPPALVYANGDPATGNGNVQVGATYLAPGSHITTSPNSGNKAFVLPAIDAAVVEVYPGPAVLQLIYPPPGETIVALATDAAFPVLASGLPYVGYRFTRFAAVLGGPYFWTVEQFRADGVTPVGGTVTSVDISTSSGGLTVGGGPISGAGTLTVDLAADLETLVGFTGTHAILSADGVGNWQAVVPGTYLTFVGNTLSTALPVEMTSLVGLAAVGYIPVGLGSSTWGNLQLSADFLVVAGSLTVVYPTSTNGETVCTTFTITGTTGTYQATGNTITLPSAGTYRIVGQIRGEIQPGAAGTHRILVQLRDNTAGAFVTNTETLAALGSQNGVLVNQTGALVAVVTVTGATVVELYAARTGTVWTSSQVLSDTNGRSKLEWEKIQN